MNKTKNILSPIQINCIIWIRGNITLKEMEKIHNHSSVRKSKNMNAMFVNPAGAHKKINLIYHAVSKFLARLIEIRITYSSILNIYKTTHAGFIA